MCGSFQGRHVRGQQQALGGALVGGADNAKGGKTLLRPEAARPLVGANQAGVLLPHGRGDDAVGDTHADYEPEP